MAGNINIFGVKFAYPRGLRKSPGTNAFASCVGEKMTGKSGNKSAHRQAFREAAHACAGKRG